MLYSGPPVPEPPHWGMKAYNLDSWSSEEDACRLLGPMMRHSPNHEWIDWTHHPAYARPDPPPPRRR